jgi:lysophospholipase L1-like esterase
MTDQISFKKAAAFCAMILIFFLALAEYICKWEEKLHSATRPSILAYQQIPQSFIKRQTLADGRQILRISGVTASYQQVAQEKPAGQIRIGVLGASTVVGMGYTPTWSFAGMLQRLCDTAGKNVRVINLGRTGYSSRQLVTLASEALGKLDLDHLIIYSGHNEFLEVNARLTAGDDLSGHSARSKGWLSKSALYRTMYRTIFSATRHTADTQADAQKSLPLPAGVRPIVKEEYIKNLTDIITLAKGRCPVSICTLPANLEFGPTSKEPFFLSPEDDQKWDALVEANGFARLGRNADSTKAFDRAVLAAPESEKDAVRMIAGSHLQKSQTALQAIEASRKMKPGDMDNTALFTLALACAQTGGWPVFGIHEGNFLRHHAGSYFGTYAKGRIEKYKGHNDSAFALLSSARNLDPRRIRIPSPFNDALRMLAGNQDAGLIELAADSWTYEHFNDYCHFNLDGNLFVANKLYAHLFNQSPPQVGQPSAWLSGRTADFYLPEYWLGVDAALWSIYSQRPQALGVIAPDLQTTPFKNPGDAFWAANRAYFTWAGANDMLEAQMENTYRSELDGAMNTTARRALRYFYTAESTPAKANEFADEPVAKPFPGQPD